MALVDNLPALEEIAENASRASRKLRRFIAERIEIQDGGGEVMPLVQEQLLTLRTEILALNLLIRQAAQTLNT